ncbi:MAG: alpha/beta hydrolase [Clostridiales bacterium]|nr:alpha/beta hydrolase [Clostridiales bacterium]
MRIIKTTSDFSEVVQIKGFLHDNSDVSESRKHWPCVLVAPGGGYESLAGHEGDSVALRFFVEGYSTFTLAYSIFDPDAPNQDALGLNPLRDISWAVQTIRKNSADWNIDPRKIIVLGFSAGGHLAASLGVLWNSEEIQAIWNTENGNNRPDALVLCYPVITAGKFSHRGSIDKLAGDGDRAFYSLETHVGRHTPPTFIWHTMDDSAVPVENSLLFAAALRKSGVPFECHIYNTGVHGQSLADGNVARLNTHCATWFELCKQWLESALN